MICHGMCKTCHRDLENRDSLFKSTWLISLKQFKVIRQVIPNNLYAFVRERVINVSVGKLCKGRQCTLYAGVLTQEVKNIHSNCKALSCPLFLKQGY